MENAPLTKPKKTNYSRSLFLLAVLGTAFKSMTSLAVRSPVYEGVICAARRLPLPEPII